MTNWYDNVPVPVDSNGREVTLDTSELLLDGERRIVMCYLYGPRTRRWYVEFAGVDERRHLTHCTLPDSWELLENDASNGLCEYFGMGDGEDCNDCPARRDRLRLSHGCNSVMAQDIIRRAKALAGVAE